jgi:hypothetical protein
MKLKVQKQIQSKILKDKQEFFKAIDNILKNTGLIFLKEYKKQTPVDRGELRRNISVFSTGFLKYNVGIQTGKLLDRLSILYEGTGKYKGASDFGYTTGRVRASNFYGLGSREKMIKYFAQLRRRGVIMSIKPNKIALRTVKNTKNEALSFFKRELNKNL